MTVFQTQNQPLNEREIHLLSSAIESCLAIEVPEDANESVKSVQNAIRIAYGDGDIVHAGILMLAATCIAAETYNIAIRLMLSIGMADMMNQMARDN